MRSVKMEMIFIKILHLVQFAGNCWADVWAQYRKEQAYYRIKQRMSRVAHQTHLLEKKKKIIAELLEEACLHKISHLYLLNADQLQEIKKTLETIGQEIPKCSALRKYIEGKLNEINARIEYSRKHGWRSTAYAATSSLWTRASGLVWSDRSIHEEKIIREVIKATEEALEASLAHEKQSLRTAWDEHEKNYGKPLTDAEKANIQNNFQQYRKEIEACRETIAQHTLEDSEAQRKLKRRINELKEKISKCTQALSPIARFYHEMLESDKAYQESLKEQEDALHTADEAEQFLEAVDEELKCRGMVSVEQPDEVKPPKKDETKQPDEVKPSKQDETKQQENVEALLEKISAVIMPLAQHIRTNQLYAEADLAPIVSETTPSATPYKFAIRECDAEWIRQLKRTHNLLAELMVLLSKYSASKHQHLQLLPLSHQLIKLCSQLGDLVAGVDTLTLYVQESWFVPLKELFSVAQALVLAPEKADEFSQQATASSNAVQSQERVDSSAAARIKAINILVPEVKQIKKDYKEWLVDLPSNLPGRVELDRDLTELFKMLNDLLGVKRRLGATIKMGARGFDLFDSSEFKRLMDLISKVSAAVGSDFVREKFSYYCKQITDHLSSVMQHVLVEEIQMGYRAGTFTEMLYQQVEVLAGAGLVDMPILYDAQISYLINHAQLTDNDNVKEHFVSYINSLLVRYAAKQTKEWAATKKKLQEEQVTINLEVVKIRDQINKKTNGWLSGTEGKNLYAQEQRLKVRSAQINRDIIAKNRETEFLKRFAKAKHEERAELLGNHAKQQKVLATLNVAVRQLTIVKWEIYNYEYKTFIKHIDNINELIKLFEEYIQQLANPNATPNDITVAVDTIKDRLVSSRTSLPPAMTHLFDLAWRAIKDDISLSEIPAKNPTEAAPAVVPSSKTVRTEAAKLVDSTTVSDDEFIVEPNQILQQELMKYAHEEAAKLDVKDAWYARNIIEHLEIFVEMWSKEKQQDMRVFKRRMEILFALQAKNAPDYSVLSHPMDVKIVYLLTLGGEHGLGFHKTIFSSEGMKSANACFSTVQAQNAALPRKKEGDSVSPKEITDAITAYRRANQLFQFCSFRQGQHHFLTDRL